MVNLKITRLLGRGGFGFVSLAISQPKDAAGINLASLVAVKSADICRLRFLQREGKLLQRFSCCRHILRCYGSFISCKDGVLLYNLWLEYASGGSLADHIRRSQGGLAEYEQRWYTKCLLKGLSHIHMQGYAHCDIKPQNILIVGGSSRNSGFRTRRRMVEGEVLKIADFGHTKKTGKKLNDKGNGGGWRGTPLYAAPECVLYQEYEPWSDIWALGCTVLEMITGKPAWECDVGTEACALLYRIGFTTQVPEIPSWVSEEARDFLRRCLVRDPRSRWTVDMLLAHPFVSSKIMIPSK
ncbi:Mitogen-activated protein kinase kinase kinase [Bertholletia excelsa]